MQIDPARHKSLPWRVHSLAPDFDLVDVWEMPIEADPAQGETFDTFFDLVWQNGIESNNAVTRLLIWMRGAMNVLGWERPSPIPGTTQLSVAERLSDPDLRANRAPPNTFRETAITRLRLVYRFEHEALLELNNRTIVGLIHFGWADAPGGKKTPHLSVYIKSRGLGSRIYMALIEPFRGWFVYPAWSRHMGRLWRQKAAPQTIA